MPKVQISGTSKGGSSDGPKTTENPAPRPKE